MTNTMPSIVNEVSAMLVARTILRAGSDQQVYSTLHLWNDSLPPGGVGSKIFVCNSDGRFAYIGAMTISLRSFPAVRAVL